MEETQFYRNRPLGQILKFLGLIDEGQIQEALLIQRKEGGRIGEILVRLGYIAAEEIDIALGVQKGPGMQGPPGAAGL